VSIPWNEFLERVRGRHSSLLAFATDWWHYNMPLLQRIRQLVSAPANLLEVGTGTGALSVFLAAHGYSVVGIDNDSQVIAGAKEFAEYFRVACRFELGDAFNLSAYRGSFDLAFSSGVIEHFSPEDASRMLREQGMAATYVLVSVPTWYALKNDPLTEASGARPIRLRELKRICRQAGLEVLTGFGYGVPDGPFSAVYRHLLPHGIQWLLQTYFSYACTVGCIARFHDHASRSGVFE
jgi:SAM-dependent methyltransferase